MLDRHDARTISANVDEVLEALRANLKEHNEILAEAKIGFRKECEKALEKALSQVGARLTKLTKTGACSMNPIIFPMTPPRDHSKEFTTVIKMLELHKAAHEGNPDNHAQGCGVDLKPALPARPATLELKAVDVQRFVLNEWDWMDDFLLTNSSYSGKSLTLASNKGLV